MTATEGSKPVLHYDDVTLRRDGAVITAGLTWRVSHGERWIVLGPNGSGKTSLLQMASGDLHPTSGRVHVLGQTLGRSDVRQLRTRVAVVSSSVTRALRREIPVIDVVLSGRHAALETWWDHYTPEDRAQAAELLRAAGLARAAERPFGSLSEGERQQVLLARARMAMPSLLIFDEPAAGLDLAARELLLESLEAAAVDPDVPAIIFVTHHVEEVPDGFTHLLLLSAAGEVTAGPIATTLTSDTLSATFGLPVTLHRFEGRYAVRRRPVPLV